MNKEYDHMALLYAAARYAYERKYGKLMSWIEENYFQGKVFPGEYYRYADDFIYRMDVTELSYGAVLELAYKALVKEDHRQFLLGLKIVYAKLKGNQRYTYYDRDQIGELLSELSENYGFAPLEHGPAKIPELLLDQCQVYLPIGFDGMGLEEYRLGSTRSFYDHYPSVQEKVLEKEYHAAINQGNIYQHIVEIDHYINHEGTALTRFHWLHLARLLLAHYATEKAPWSSDLTTGLLRVYLGLKDCCGQEEFEDILVQMVSGTLRIALKKIMGVDQPRAAGELPNILNYVINAYLLAENSKLLDYILELIKGMNREAPEQEFLVIKNWLMEQQAKAG